VPPRESTEGCPCHLGNPRAGCPCHLGNPRAGCPCHLRNPRAGCPCHPMNLSPSYVPFLRALLGASAAPSVNDRTAAECWRWFSALLARSPRVLLLTRSPRGACIWAERRRRLRAAPGADAGNAEPGTRLGAFAGTTSAAKSEQRFRAGPLLLSRHAGDEGTTSAAETEQRFRVSRTRPAGGERN